MGFAERVHASPARRATRVPGSWGGHQSCVRPMSQGAVWEVPLPREGRVTGKGLAVPNVPFWMHSTKYEERGMGAERANLR